MIAEMAMSKRSSCALRSERPLTSTNTVPSRAVQASHAPDGSKAHDVRILAPPVRAIACRKVMRASPEERDHSRSFGEGGMEEWFHRSGPAALGSYQDLVASSCCPLHSLLQCGALDPHLGVGAGRGDQASAVGRGLTCTSKDVRTGVPLPHCLCSGV